MLFHTAPVGNHYVDWLLYYWDIKTKAHCFPCIWTHVNVSFLTIFSIFHCTTWLTCLICSYVLRPFIYRTEGKHYLLKMCSVIQLMIKNRRQAYNWISACWYLFVWLTNYTISIYLLFSTSIINRFFSYRYPGFGNENPCKCSLNQG